jgi:acyl-CoA thioester hydrolase
MSKTSIQHRVGYHETDHYGVVFFARFFNWFEMGEAEALRKVGWSLKDMESAGIFLMVVKVHCEYKNPAKYDDIVNIEAGVSEIGNKSLQWDYRVLNASSNQLLAEGYSVHVCVNREGESILVPGKLRELLDF